MCGGDAACCQITSATCFCCVPFCCSVDQYLAGGATFNALPPGMRSMLGCAGAPARMMADQNVPHHQPAPGSTAAAAAAAGLLSQAACRLAGFGGLLDARGRAQLAALARFGVVVGGSPISHHHQHPQPYRPPHHQQMAPLPYAAAAQRHQFLPPAPVFTPADLHLVLYGYARSRTDDEQQSAATGAHSLSGLRINELSYGTTDKKTRMWANAQPDGRPAEHRWRPLFNAAKFG